MTVYVDNMRIQKGGKVWSHLMADSMDELHQFAQGIGLKREWLHSGDHYDVTEKKRAIAVKAGAKEVEPIDLVPIRRKLRQLMRAEEESECQMKAISLWQPYASLVSLGAKKFETRSWETAYRGPLLIHAAKRWTGEQRQLFQGNNPVAQAFRLAIYPTYGHADALPLGCFVALVDLVQIFPTEAVIINSKERRFGDYSAGRFAWQLENLRTFEPIPARGYQALWTPDAGVVELVNERVAATRAGG